MFVACSSCLFIGFLAGISGVGLQVLSVIPGVVPPGLIDNDSYAHDQSMTLIYTALAFLVAGFTFGAIRSFLRDPHVRPDLKGRIVEALTKNLPNLDKIVRKGNPAHSRRDKKDG
jgi:hypothetical protein